MSSSWMKRVTAREAGARWPTDEHGEMQPSLADVGGDVDGLGWEFTGQSGEFVWAVFRDDSGPVPVFSSVRGAGLLPPRDELAEMTREAVSDLLAAAGLADEVGWMTGNITAALLFASLDVTSWEGEEWALESGDDDAPRAWATADDLRAPFAWLRARTTEQNAVVGIYQDDAVFGLNFSPAQTQPVLPDVDAGSVRSRRDVPVVHGRLTRVDAVYDTEVDGAVAPGVFTEVLLRGDLGSALLIAAEAYSRHEWHLYDESVVVLADLAAADSLAWIPHRQPWRPSPARPW